MNTTSLELCRMLQETLAGRNDHSRQILAKIRAFPHIILHGAGLFGRGILEFLESAGLAREKISWWDCNYDKPAMMEGIPVFPPFTGDFPPDSTLVIHCIPSAPMESQAVPESYSRFDGISFLMCPFLVGGRDTLAFCVKNSRCKAVRCPKFGNETSREDEGKSEGKQAAWFLDNFTFMINQKCTLRCKHCCLYLNHFIREDRIMFPVRQIVADIHRISTVYDFIRRVTILGGEIFLHPDLPVIVNCALSQNNFGVVRIFTNGVCDISDEMIGILKHERCLVQFSDYTEQLTEKQKRLFRTNVEKMNQAGIEHYIMRHAWEEPPTLHRLEYSDGQMRKMKATCEGHKYCRQVVNGVYYPCNPAASIRQHHLSDYAGDRVILGECANIEDVRNRIADCDNQPFYESCRHCDLRGKLIPAGEQEIDNRYFEMKLLSNRLNDPCQTLD